MNKPDWRDFQAFMVILAIIALGIFGWSEFYGSKMLRKENATLKLMIEQAQARKEDTSSVDLAGSVKNITSGIAAKRDALFSTIDSIRSSFDGLSKSMKRNLWLAQDINRRLRDENSDPPCSLEVLVDTSGTNNKLTWDDDDSTDIGILMMDSTKVPEKTYFLVIENSVGSELRFFLRNDSLVIDGDLPISDAARMFVERVRELNDSLVIDGDLPISDAARMFVECVRELLVRGY